MDIVILPNSTSNNDVAEVKGYIRWMNRLSGPIIDYHQFDHFDVVSVVESNIVQCQTLTSSRSNGAPDEDLDGDTYVCGSRDLILH